MHIIALSIAEKVKVLFFSHDTHVIFLHLPLTTVQHQRRWEYFLISEVGVEVGQPLVQINHKHISSAHGVDKLRAKQLEGLLSWLLLNFNCNCFFVEVYLSGFVVEVHLAVAVAVYNQHMLFLVDCDLKFLRQTL